uniref:A-kinase anchor protein 2 C-terminal domain-containing protein n=1 Tax=Stegastes partitus TaxID=144197 RepID=A0A3B5AT91_9TELE
MPEESEQHRVAGTEAGDSGDEQSDSWAPEELPVIISHETSSEIPFLSTGQRFSAAGTSMEKQIHEAAQRKKNLQRAGGVFNLADNPDVLEIPFKTNISLESLLTKADAGHRSDWQFSEQKMQREISQEIQRELVLVNQGKIPGGYSKGEVRQLKETKLLFEAFQQDNTEGPTRLRKPPTSVIKGPVYPSVLERTRSLEMFSLKSYPVSRAHSLRSMDSLRTDGGVSRMGGAGSESPILKQNPFFKLRPALALQPEVEKDIREAKQREEELRRQRCTLYGENRQNSEDEDESRRLISHSKSSSFLCLISQQEPKVHKAGGHKAPLWQRWESGMINGQPAKEKK